MAGKRISWISIAKGLGIILLAVGHSGAPIALTRLVYVFRMPFFFIISGYCLSDKYFNDMPGLINRRYNSLLKPYFKYYLILFFLRPLLFGAHIYSSLSGIHELETVKDIFVHIIRVLFFVPAEPLLGAMWFLPELFGANILSVMLLSRIKQYSHKTASRYILSLGVPLILTIIVYYLCDRFLPIDGILIYRGLPFATMFVISGYWLKDLYNKLAGNAFYLMLILGAGVFYSGHMCTISIYKVVPFYLSAMAGTMLVFKFSQFLEKFESRRFVCWLKYIGDNSIQIMIWHFLAFKAVSFAIVLAKGLPIEYVGYHPIIKGQGDWLWILYTIAGVVLPIVVYSVVQSFKTSK